MVAILAKIPQLIRASKAARAVRFTNKAAKLKSAEKAARTAGKIEKADKLAAKSIRLSDKSVKLEKAATKVGWGEKGLQVVDNGIGLTAKGIGSIAKGIGSIAKGVGWVVAHPVKTVLGLFAAGTAYTMATDYNKDKSVLQNVGEAGVKVGGKVVDGLGEVVDGAVNGENSGGGDGDKSIWSKMGEFIHGLPGWAKLLGTGVVGFGILKLLGGLLGMGGGLFSMLPMLAMAGACLGVGSLALGIVKKNSNPQNSPTQQENVTQNSLQVEQERRSSPAQDQTPAPKKSENSPSREIQTPTLENSASRVADTTPRPSNTAASVLGGATGKPNKQPNNTPTLSA